MLFNHYRALVKPNEAERYWNIKPVPKANVVQMPRSQTQDARAQGETRRVL
jgi:hypothetical protein